MNLYIIYIKYIPKEDIKYGLLNIIYKIVIIWEIHLKIKLNEIFEVEEKKKIKNKNISRIKSNNKLFMVWSKYIKLYKHF